MKDIQNASHSEADQQVEQDDQVMRDQYAAFGIAWKNGAAEGESSIDDLQDDEETYGSEQSNDLAKDQEVLRGLRVKYNGEERVIESEDEIRGYAEKGMNYDKIKDRAQQYESALDRIARKQGYNDHAELMRNLDKFEEQQAQRERDEFDQLKQQLLADAEEVGMDPAKFEQYLEEHPVIKRAREVVQQSEQRQQHDQQALVHQQAVQSWEALFSKYPDLAKSVNQDGTGADWLTADMQAKLQRGYDPIDAYELVHRDNLAAQSRKQVTQDVLKQQRLNKRSQVTGGVSGQDLTPEVPEDLREGFALFGLNPKSASKYVKNSR